MRVHLGRINLFPVKSLDGVAVEEARITGGGILEHDRVYALFDGAGKTVNGKRHPRIHRLRTRFSSDFGEVRISDPGSAAEGQFFLVEEGPLNRWLSDYFGFPVRLMRDREKGFPDDRDASGPSVVSVASLREVARWYPGMTLDGARRRFRTNLELDGANVPPFWEDGLFGEPDERKRFQVGSVRVLGHNPCQRCAVPTRDADTGEPTSGFAQEFSERRRLSLPPWANLSRFNHTYRLAVNTSIPPSESGKRLRLGDPVEIAAGPDS